MNKTDIARKMAQKGNIEISQSTAKYVIDEIEDIIKEELLNGGFVSLAGFFTMDVQIAKPRNYKHPATGEIVKSSEKYVPKCRFSNTFKKEISESVVGV